MPLRRRRFSACSIMARLRLWMLPVLRGGETVRGDAVFSGAAGCRAGSSGCSSNRRLAARWNSSAERGGAFSSAMRAASMAAGSSAAEKSGISPSSSEGLGIWADAAGLGGRAVCWGLGFAAGRGGGATGTSAGRTGSAADAAALPCGTARRARDAAAAAAPMVVSSVGSGDGGSSCGCAGALEAAGAGLAGIGDSKVMVPTGTGFSAPGRGTADLPRAAGLRRTVTRVPAARGWPSPLTSSRGCSRPGRKVMVEPLRCNPSARRRTRSRMLLAMAVSVRSGLRAQAAAPCLLHSSTKGAWPTVAGI